MEGWRETNGDGGRRDGKNRRKEKGKGKNVKPYLSLNTSKEMLSGQTGLV